MYTRFVTHQSSRFHFKIKMSKANISGLQQLKYIHWHQPKTEKKCEFKEVCKPCAASCGCKLPTFTPAQSTGLSHCNQTAAPCAQNKCWWNAKHPGHYRPPPAPVTSATFPSRRKGTAGSISAIARLSVTQPPLSCAMPACNAMHCTALWAM